MRFGAPALAACCATLTPLVARADPQWNAALMTGIAGVGSPAGAWDGTCWWNGVRADVVFGRSRNSDFGLGPHVEATTAAFDDVRLGGGLTFHVPWHPYFPLVLSAAGHARHVDSTWEPGVGAYAFIGSRSYNFHSSYIMAGGLIVGYQRSLAGTREEAIVIAVQLDGLILALPVLLAYDWVRGPPTE